MITIFNSHNTVIRKKASDYLLEKKYKFDSEKMKQSTDDSRKILEGQLSSIKKLNGRIYMYIHFNNSLSSVLRLFYEVAV